MGIVRRIYSIRICIHMDEGTHMNECKCVVSVLLTFVRYPVSSSVDTDVGSLADIEKQFDVYVCILRL